MTGHTATVDQKLWQRAVAHYGHGMCIYPEMLREPFGAPLGPPRKPSPIPGAETGGTPLTDAPPHPAGDLGTDRVRHRHSETDTAPLRHDKIRTEPVRLFTQVNEFVKLTYQDAREKFGDETARLRSILGVSHAECDSCNFYARSLHTITSAWTDIAVRLNLMANLIEGIREAQQRIDQTLTPGG